MDQKYFGQMSQIEEDFVSNTFCRKKKFAYEIINATKTIEIISFDCISINLKTLPRSTLSFCWSEVRKLSVVVLFVI